MKTKVVLDDELVAEAVRLSGIQKEEELLHEALRMFVESKRRKSLLDLAGRIQFAPGYDHKALREDQR